MIFSLHPRPPPPPPQGLEGRTKAGLASYCRGAPPPRALGHTTTSFSMASVARGGFTTSSFNKPLMPCHFSPFGTRSLGLGTDEPLESGVAMADESAACGMHLGSAAVLCPLLLLRAEELGKEPFLDFSIFTCLRMFFDFFMRYSSPTLSVGLQQICNVGKRSHTHTHTHTHSTFCPCVCAPQNGGKKRLCVVKRGREGEKEGRKKEGKVLCSSDHDMLYLK